MLEELQRRNFAPTTISTDLHAVEQFARHFKCRPTESEPLSDVPGVSATAPLDSPLHVAALRFFFVETLKRRYVLDDTPHP